MSTPIENRYEFVYLFDVENGNPNGDPDAGNMPRIDPETNHGLVTDVCIKRKIRNYVDILKRDETGFEIYVREKAILNKQNERAYLANPDIERPVQKKLPKKVEEAQRITQWMCGNFFDIRAFGAVMTTEVNCGQVCGPVQINFSKSIEPIVPLEISITRMAVTTEREAEEQSGDNRTMGRKHIVPYGLYRSEGYISANLAKKTGFSGEDLDLLWEALRNMFEHDRSAARGKMSARKLVVFRHDSAVGNAHAHELFMRVTVTRATDTDIPARSYDDYRVEVNNRDLPAGVNLIEIL